MSASFVVKFPGTLFWNMKAATHLDQLEHQAQDGSGVDDVVQLDNVGMS